MITRPENDVDFSVGRSSYHDFEDDGIVLNTGNDGIVRCIDAYRGMTTSDEARGGIPCGISWSDDGNKIKAKLGKPYQEYGLTGKGARQYVYQAGNMMFSLVVDTLDKEGIKFWRVREMWHEDFGVEKNYRQDLKDLGNNIKKHCFQIDRVHPVDNRGPFRVEFHLF